MPRCRTWSKLRGIPLLPRRYDVGIDLFSFFLFLFLTNNSKQAKRPASAHRKAGRFAFAMMVVDVDLVFTVPEFPAGDIINAIAVGIVSGLSATGADQIAKQMKK